jgi:hypothetical protein
MQERPKSGQIFQVARFEAKSNNLAVKIKAWALLQEQEQEQAREPVLEQAQGRDSQDRRLVFHRKSAEHSGRPVSHPSSAQVFPLV